KGSLYLFDFDVNTGRVNSSMALNDDRVYYGVEFSSNSTKLYATGLLIENSGSLGNLEIVQFDLNEPDIPNSIYTVSTFPEGYGNEVSGSLQLAIDKKIYHAVPEDKLSVIRTPNLRGINSDFRLFEVDLGDRSATYGLPPFVQSFFETLVTIENFCEGQPTTFTTDSSGEVRSINWNFGDPASGGNNVSGGLNPTHTFSSHGTFTVSLDVEYNNGNTRNFLEFVEIAEIPNVNSSIELIQCDTDGVEDGISQFNLEEAIELFGNNNDDMHALFFETMADAALNNNQLEPIGYSNLTNGQTIFARAFENAECYTVVEIVLVVQPFSDLGTYTSITVCDETEGGLATFVEVADAYETISNDFPEIESLTFYATKEKALLEQEELPIEKHLFGPFDERVLFFRLENANACDAIGRLELEVIYKPRFEDEVNLNLCNGQVQLTAVEGFEGYSWSNGSSTASISVDSAGQYYVTLFTEQCSYTQRFVVAESPEIEIEDIAVSDFKQRNEISIFVRNESESVRYSLDNGSNYQVSNRFANVLPGVYNLLVTNDCTTLEQTIVVGGLDSFFTPNNDGINDIWSLANSEFFPDFKLSVYDRYGKLLSTFSDSSNGWDGTFNGKQMSSSDYWYRLELESGRVVHGHFSLKR
ncbi:MAG: T9SS type B sorting domain-containing protein, partial [Aurantibacter sp.]